MKHWYSDAHPMRKGCALLACCLLPAAAAQPQRGAVSYVRDVKPVLRARCYSCHGALKQEGGLRLDTAQSIRRGGARGPILVAGRADQSRLWLRVAEKESTRRMPPEGEALSAAELAHVRDWIGQGAPTPEREAAEADPRQHWAFRPVVRPAIPRVRNAGWVRNPVDAFVLAELEQRGLTPAPPASPETLLRRITLDLTGLPPTREELHAFLADRAPDAYEKVVDRLLAGPAYGERWGRHWMDVWRYSDWYGRRDQNDVRNSYALIWRWRDWIIRSLNEDRGYDRMVTEMLAADEVCPEDDQAIVATGFLVRNWYSLNYNQWMRDAVEHTSKAFLGLTVNCAHCHDHKYDPITNKDYFAFRAVFEPLELRRDRVAGEADPGPFQKYIYASSTAPVKSGLIRIFDEKLDAQTFRYHKGDERNRVEGEGAVSPGGPAFLGGDRMRVAPVPLPPAAWYPGLKSFIVTEDLESAEKAAAAARHLAPADPLRLAAAEAVLAALQARIAADRARYTPGGSDAAGAARSAARLETQAALRVAEEQAVLTERALTAAREKAAADPKAAAAVKPAEEKAKAAQAALSTARTAAAGDPKEQYTPLSPVYPKTSTGRRRALAAWITSPTNPLTPRVAVNHIWMRHFGRPLVDTVFDFGRNGKAPSHPALLDWLASLWVGNPDADAPRHSNSDAPAGLRKKEPPATGPAMTPEKPEARGWSMKRIHRLLVTSATYRMASAGSGRAGAARDPENRFLWRFPSRRLEAEAVRDSILYAAGNLDRTMGGPELDNRGDDGLRRSLYYSVYAEEGGAMRFLNTFDAPDPCDCYRRTDSVVPQQALALTNSRLSREQSAALATKFWAVVGSEPPARRSDALVTAAFEQVLTRRPTPAERVACREFLLRQAALYRIQAAASAPAADPERRAGESLVQALFSHHEFVTLR